MRPGEVDALTLSCVPPAQTGSFNATSAASCVERMIINCAACAVLVWGMTMPLVDCKIPGGTSRMLPRPVADRVGQPEDATGWRSCDATDGPKYVLRAGRRIDQTIRTFVVVHPRERQLGYLPDHNNAQRLRGGYVVRVRHLHREVTRVFHRGRSEERRVGKEGTSR